MSDDYLRALEHRWHTSGDPDDEARYLSARLRTGELNPTHLELAAYLDHGPAVTALGSAAPAGEHVPFGRWATSMDAPAWTRVGQLLLVEARQELAALSSGPDVREALQELQALLGEGDVADAWTLLAGLTPQIDALRYRLVDLEDFGVTAVARDVLHLARCAESVLRFRAPGTAPLSAGEQASWGMALAKVCSAGGIGHEQGPRLLTPELLGEAHCWNPLSSSTSEVASLQGEVEYLQARRAAGDLALGRLRLAAYAGHEAAQAALSDEAREPPTELAPWVEGLRAFGPWAQRSFLAALVDAVPNVLGAASPIQGEIAQMEPLELALAAARLSEECLASWRESGSAPASREADRACARLREAAEAPQLAPLPRLRGVILLHLESLGALIASDPSPHLERALTHLALGRSTEELQRYAAKAQRALTRRALTHPAPRPG